MAKSAKVKPTYMTRKKPITIGLHDVVRALEVIGDSKKMTKFVAEAKKKKAFVRVDADTVNFVKDFFANNGLHDHPVGKHIVNAPLKLTATPIAGAARRSAQPPTKDFECKFGTH